MSDGSLQPRNCLEELQAGLEDRIKKDFGKQSPILKKCNDKQLKWPDSQLDGFRAVDPFRKIDDVWI